MSGAVIYAGGIAHPFEQAAPALRTILEDVGFAARISFELDEVLGWLKADADALLVVYALRWSMTQHEKYATHRAQWSLVLADTAREAITRHVGAGAGLLGVHTASICFDNWPEWRDVLGGAWRWGKSWHPALGPVQVRLDRTHFLTRGLPDFSLNDEVYSDLDFAPGVEIAGHAEGQQDEASRATGSQPALWTHRYGRGRVVCDSLGHDAASLGHPVHRRLLQRAALWICGQPQQIVEAT
jgi:type 1 glutamine amidotransferase